jgi:hypothetical protein
VDDECLAADAACEHVDPDARGAVVVKARVTGLPPVIEPCLRALVAPQQLERPVAIAARRVDLDRLGCGAGELHALLGRETHHRILHSCERR